MGPRSRNDRTNGRPLTIFALIFSVTGLLASLVPFFGAIAVPIGLIGLVLGIVAFLTKNKNQLRKQSPLIALVLSLIGISIGYNNYLNHKDAVDLLLGIEGAKSDLLLVPKDSPLREAVERGSGHSEAEIEKRKSETEKNRLAEPVKETLIEEDSLPKHGSHIKLKQLMAAPSKSYYYSLVDNLRIRAKPTTKSEVLGKIRFGHRVKYLDEKSNEKEVIEIGGKEQNDYWYKIPYTNQGGWIYGGALLNAAESSTQKFSGKIIKTYNFISADSLTALIGREIADGHIYSGIMTFNKGEQNNLKSTGRFYFEGVSPADYYYMRGHGDTDEVTGYTKEGRLDGLFEHHKSLFESWETLKIIFDNGKCISYEMEENQEGEIQRCKGVNPEDCSYEAIYRKLKPVK